MGVDVRITSRVSKVEGGAMMIGAIEFMRNWREMCKTHERCDECEYNNMVTCLMPEILTDADINKLIGTVMAWKNRQEASNE